MDSDQESSECPLCLEVLEADDLNFYPCTCCYQICRFCWHRIRTDENGLCPACRKPYSENPAQFKPLTDEEIQQVKRERKLKDSNKKPKVTESRKHLTNLRVVQRNLVFVNGLPSRLADTELLRRNDHFGKYGKIVKLVTSPAHNGQSNSICVYITYSRSEEALRAIQALANYQVDGRTLKATLGTTKYCSRYLKGASCQKTDCLYLHEPGDQLASFTKEQMQQGLHLDYEKKLMEQYTNKHASAQSTNTPTNGRAPANAQNNEYPQRRKHPNQPTPLLPPSNAAIPVNGHSDLESGDETQHHHHNTSNEYNTEPFTSTTAINVDSDSTSTSSQTSSEHDPQVASSSSSTNQTQAHHVSPTTNWPEERTSFFSANNLASSQSNTSKPVSPPMNTPANTLHYSPASTNSSHLLPDSTTTNNHHPNNNNHHQHQHHTGKSSDQVPEYKLFSSNTPSLHTILFGNHENNQSNSALSHRALLNGADHDVRVIEKRLMECSLSNGDASSSLFHTQEQDELGFDPCSLFMSALAPDIEDERRPSSSSGSSRLFSNAYSSYPSQYPPNMNPLQGPINPSWFTQQQQQQQQYSPYQEPHAALHKNGAAPQKPLPLPQHQQQQQQQQQRYPPPYNGSSARQIWNGHQPPHPQQQQQQYAPQLPSRLDYNNQMQPQRLPTRQVSPSPQYPHALNNNHTHNPTKNTYSSNNTVTTNNSNDGWMNLHSIDPAIISFGNKVDTAAAPQWSSTTQSQGTSALPSGNNLISTSRWPQSQSQPVQFPTHMMTNGIYAPYSTASGVDDGSRS